MNMFIILKCYEFYLSGTVLYYFEDMQYSCFKKKNNNKKTTKKQQVTEIMFINNMSRC